MKLFVQIMDDDGKVLAEHTADPCQPSRWNAPTGKQLVGNMPQNASDVKNNGTYELFGITFQPHLRVDRPNGWESPPPSGKPSALGLPAGFPDLSTRSSTPWSKTAPTRSVRTNNQQNPQPDFPPAVISRG